ncbi:MAG: hypothetical protein RBU30_27885 [Polyangia bacterium]|jgi:hypothetical protein|nr:hypothetical protein [Polyangia bacterium]
MQETIFEAPSLALDESRLGWLHIDAAENSMVEDRMDEMYGTEPPPLVQAEWGMR